MQLRHLIGASVFFFFALSSRADILFLDVNDGRKEIEAAKKAAAIRGEKLIVLPSSSGNREQLNPSSLSKELAKLKESGVKLTSMVVSGHDGNGHFGGTNGYLDDISIAQAFAQNAPVGDNIRSMMMWGCYSTNIGSLSANWKKTLPNVELIAGYDSVAPLSDKPANWQYLIDVLVKEKKLTQIKDANELKKALKGLEGVNLLNASICVEDNYADHKVALNLRDAKKLCVGQIEALQPMYACYLNATEPRCSNPPENTGSSELRDTYNKLQESRHCLELNSENLSSLSTMPSPDTLIRLIYFKNVKANFSERYPDYIPRVNELLKSINAPENLLWGDIKKMSRGDILKKLNAMGDYLSTALKDRGPNSPEIEALQGGYSGLQMVLGSLWVPFSWVEPAASEPLQVVGTYVQGMSKDSVSKTRVEFETRRASDDLSKKIDDVLRKNSSAYSAAVEKSEKLVSELNARSEVDNTSPAQAAKTTKLQDEYIQSLSDAHGIKMRELEKPELKAQLKAVATELGKQPYSNAEGLKIYQESLQKLAANPGSIANTSQGMLGAVTLGGDYYGYGGGMVGAPAMRPPSEVFGR